MQYPLVRAKKEMIIEERCTQIERANRLLLEKMTNILAGPATHNMNRTTASQFAGGSPKRHAAYPASNKHSQQKLPNTLSVRKNSNSRMDDRRIKNSLFKERSKIEEENT